MPVGIRSDRPQDQAVSFNPLLMSTIQGALMHRFMFALALLSASSLQAQGTTNTEVYVAPITRIGDSIVVGPAVNASKRDGYDNQPAFTSDSRGVLYTVQGNGQT